MARAAASGIFCLEGEWSSDLRDRRSVKPILTLLEQLNIADSVHRDVATRDELEHYIGKWQQKRYDGYRVLYLAMHGDPGTVYLGRDELSLDELEQILAGSCKGKVIYFGSCLTLKGNNDRLQRFARATGARAVVGYRREVDWLESAAFEVLLLDRLVMGIRSDAVFNNLVRDHGRFAKSLGLVVATRAQVHKVPLRVSAST